MKNSLLVPILLLCLTVFTNCKNDKKGNETPISSTLNFNVMGNAYTSNRITFGNKPVSEFYNTVFNYISSNTLDMKNISKALKINDNTDYNFWIVVYTNKVYEKTIDINADDIIGFGICSKNNDNFDFSLYSFDNKTPSKVKSFDFGNKFPSRIFEFFKKDFGEQGTLIKSMLLFDNSSPNSPNMTKFIASPEFENLVANMHPKKEMSSSRADCGCDEMPCCDVEKCGQEDNNTYCGWEKVNGNQSWECQGCGACGGKVVANTPEFKFMDKDAFINESYSIRDGLMSKSEKGKRYTRYYYDISNKFDLAAILKVHDNVQNARFAYQTLIATKILVNGNNDDIVVDDAYYNFAKSMLNDYQEVFKNNREFITILDDIESDVEKYKGWSKSKMLNDLK